MSLDIFFREDIHNALLAANEASSATAAMATSRDTRPLDRIAERLRGELPEGSLALLDALHAAAVGNVDAMRQYRRGYKAALTTVALAFGLSPAIISGRGPSSCSGQAETLEVEAKTVEEALPVGGEDDSPSSTISHELSAIGHRPKKR